MFRKFGDKTAAAKLALQTEHEWEYSRDADTTKTKDGAVVADGGLETKLSITAIGTKESTANSKFPKDNHKKKNTMRPQAKPM